MNVWKN